MLVRFKSSNAKNATSSLYPRRKSTIPKVSWKDEVYHNTPLPNDSEGPAMISFLRGVLLMATCRYDGERTPPGSCSTSSGTSCDDPHSGTDVSGDGHSSRTTQAHPCPTLKEAQGDSTMELRHRTLGTRRSKSVETRDITLAGIGTMASKSSDAVEQRRCAMQGRRSEQTEKRQRALQGKRSERIKLPCQSDEKSASLKESTTRSGIPQKAVKVEIAESPQRMAFFLERSESENNRPTLNDKAPHGVGTLRPHKRGKHEVRKSKNSVHSSHSGGYGTQLKHVRKERKRSIFEGRDNQAQHGQIGKSSPEHWSRLEDKEQPQQGKLQSCLPERRSRLQDKDQPQLGQMHESSPELMSSRQDKDPIQLSEIHGPSSATLVKSDGTIYKGSVFNNLPHGYGTHRTPSRLYVGKFACGLPHGEGTQYYLDGSIDFEGQWVFGEPVVDIDKLDLAMLVELLHPMSLEDFLGAIASGNKSI